MRLVALMLTDDLLILVVSLPLILSEKPIDILAGIVFFVFLWL